jgi:hypothetical protein
MKTIICFVVSVLLVGCAAPNTSNLRAVGNERGGEISYAGDMASAMTAVQNHCKQFGKKAFIIKMTPQNEGGSLTFECH